MYMFKFFNVVTVETKQIDSLKAFYVNISFFLSFVVFRMTNFKVIRIHFVSWFKSLDL